MEPSFQLLESRYYGQVAFAFLKSDIDKVGITGGALFRPS